MVYGEWAEGFRLGGPQTPLPASCDLDQDGLIDGLGIVNGKATEPDELESFELGIKSSLLDDRLTMNAAVYRINWDGMPVFLVAPCFSGITVNAGTSKAEGIELEVQASVTENLMMNLSASYNDSTLTENVPNASGFGVEGDNLPGSADYNASIGLEYRFAMAGNDSFIRGDYAYVSEFYNNFAENGEPAGGYGVLNLKLGIAINQIDLDLFINNVTNADDFTWVESLYGALGSQRAYRLRPRTLGLNISYQF